MSFCFELLRTSSCLVFFGFTFEAFMQYWIRKEISPQRRVFTFFNFFFMVNLLFTHSQNSTNYTLPFYLLLLPHVIGKSPSKSNATSMQTSCTCMHMIIFGSRAFAYFQPFVGVFAFYQVLK